MSINTKLVEKAGELAGLGLPPITEKTLGEWQTAIQQPLIYNQWANAFINKIALTHFQKKKFVNPLSKFIKSMEMGEIIEEVFIDEIEAQDWGTYPPSNNLANMYEVTPPPIEVAYHQMNVDVQFPVTISHKEIKKAFSSMTSLDEFVTAIFDRVNMDAENFLYKVTKAQLDYSIGRNLMHRVPVGKVAGLTEEQFAKKLAKSIRLHARKLTFLSREYNPLAVKTVSAIQDQVMLISPEVESELDVEVLAFAMHRENVGITSSDVIVVDGWKADGVLGCLVDREFFKCYLRTFMTSEVTNQRYLYDNSFLNLDGVFSMSLFANQLCFTDEESVASKVESLTVSPSEITLYPGSIFYVVNDLRVTGNANQRVAYTITGNQDNTTVVTEQGLVTIGLNETSSSIIVKATSLADETKNSSCTITITQSANTFGAPAKQDVNVSGVNLSKMSNDELDAIGNQLGIDTKGNKNVKVDVISNFVQENSIDLSTLVKE